MLTFPDPNVETEYTDPNGSVWAFNGTGWVRQIDCDGSSGGEPPDEHWAETYLLINCDNQRDGSQGIVDATGNQRLTLVGNNRYPMVSTATPKYGTGAVAFNDIRISRIEVPMFDVRQHWTVEGWVNLGAVNNSSSTAYYSFISNWGSNGQSFNLYANGGRWWADLNWSGTGNGADHSMRTDLESATVDGEYQHIALSWDGSDYRLWVDGELGGEVSQSKNLTRTSSSLGIGSTQNSSTGGWQRYTDALVDDLRVTEGHCRYTAPFTPPLKLSTKPAIKMPLILREVGDELVFTDNDVPLKTNDVPLTTDIDLT